MFNSSLNLLIPDMIALLWMLACWMGYTYVADRNAINKREVAKVMYHHRLTWMKRMLERDNRMADVNIVIAHIRSGTLFASTSILILAGTVAILGHIDQLRTVITKLSFAAEPVSELLEMKVFVLIGIFVYAFFKYAWCLRQFNYSLILIGAAPMPDDCDEHTKATYPERAARVLTRATNTFNRGLRAYYFGLITLMWFVQPWLLMLGSVWVVMVLYRRDYRSQTLDALVPSGGSDDGSGGGSGF
jgi:uncharacterized membrane protein